MQTKHVETLAALAQLMGRGPMEDIAPVAEKASLFALSYGATLEEYLDTMRRATKVQAILKEAGLPVKADGFR